MSLLSFAWFRRAALLAAAGLLLTAAPARAADDRPEPKKPKIEVVFCLDTTGSMTGLIEGAKAKIWTICNQIAGGKPTPELKVGLVAYRDRGKEEYVTRVFDLTDDLDAVHGQLKGFRAAGGGDFPESVNEALHVAVNKITWGQDKSALRIIFLVGDAPPHMDYPDDVKYPETCKRACEKGIIINTIQCGNNADCRKYWQDICLKAEGTYVQIPADGGKITTVATPYDKDLAKINSELAGTTLVYGRADKQAKDREKAADAKALPAPVAAERAAYFAKGGGAASYDLLDAVKKGQAKLEEMKKEELPPELRKLTLKEQKEYLEKLDKRRQELSRKALELDRQRNDYIQKKLAEDKQAGKDNFDSQVLEVIRKQAKKHHIKY